jgi:23S rRNA (adenine2503-C2)-methyltransferase
LKVLIEKKDIRRLTLEELENWCKSAMLPFYRARQIYEWIWHKGARSFDTMTSLPVQFREKLGEEFIIRSLAQREKQISNDGTVKYSFQLDDNSLAEGVLIPADDRATACISTQAGCPLACNFCATGKMGFERNLEAAEIFDQVVEINNDSLIRLGHPLNNIVYMGMGEPLLNFTHTLTSIEHLMDRKYGLGISPHRITVSTAGISDGIKRLGDDKVRFQLAVSLHTAIQKKREEIMPIAHKYPLDDLSLAIKYYHEKTGSRITLEYLLLLDFNDGNKDVRELAAFCLNFPVKINIIEYNEIDGISYKRSNPERTKAFKSFLEDRNLIVNIRQSRGNDIDAACGQLATKRKTN